MPSLCRVNKDSSIKATQHLHMAPSMLGMLTPRITRGGKKAVSKKLTSATVGAEWCLRKDLKWYLNNILGQQEDSERTGAHHQA